MTSAPITPIAIFGGAFDPVHAGHVGVIDFLRSEAGFSEVWVLPSSDRNPKRPQAPARDRLACLSIALALENGKRPGVRIEAIETREHGPRDTPRFTTDTLRALGRSRDEITFVIGTDQFASLHAWKNFPSVLGQCHWLVLERPGVKPETVRAALSRYEIDGVLRREGSGMGTGTAEYRTLENTLLRFQPIRTPEVSSTSIRRELALDGALWEPRQLPEGVDAYLMRHKLYGRTS